MGVRRVERPTDHRPRPRLLTSPRMTTDLPPLPPLAASLPVVASDLHKLVMREHPDRSGQLGRAWWQVLRDAYEGTGGFLRNVEAVATRDGGPANGDAGRAGLGRSTYLTPFRRESADAFAARADRSAYQNHIAPVIDIYHGHLVRRRAQRVSALATITAWLKDVDGRGHDMGEWIAPVALRAQLYGWVAVLVDRDANARTTATALDPGEVRDWQVGYDGDLDWCRLVSEWTERDPATGAAVTIVEASVWSRTEWARVRLESAGDHQWREVYRDGSLHDLGTVPIRVLRWQESISARSLYGLSQVQGVLPLVLALFNNDSELTDHLAGANFALLAINGEPDALNNLAIGTNGGMTYPLGTNPPAFVSPDASVAMQYALNGERLIAAIYTAAKIEKPGATPTGGDVASGVAKAYDFSQTDAGLQTFARQLTRFELELVALAAAWEANGDAARVADAVAATTIAYPTRFDAAGIQSDLGAQFAVLADEMRAQLPPAVLREARLAAARGLFPEASTAVEAQFTAEIAAMYARDTAAMGTASTDPAAAAAAAADEAMDALPPAPPDALTTATP